MFSCSAERQYSVGGRRSSFTIFVVPKECGLSGSGLFVDRRDEVANTGCRHQAARAQGKFLLTGLDAVMRYLHVLFDSSEQFRLL